MSSDLAILAAAASQLFECTRDMSREAVVVALLSGLRDVSMRNIPAAGGAAGVGQAPKLFALNRMVEVLLYNIGRIYDLWAIFLRCVRCVECAGMRTPPQSTRRPRILNPALATLPLTPAAPAPCLRSHVLEVINDPKPPVRAAAIEALGRAIIGALGSLPPAAPTSADGGADSGAAAAAPHAVGQRQHRRRGAHAAGGAGGAVQRGLGARRAQRRAARAAQRAAGVGRLKVAAWG